ncbi:wax ester/triacylglycerol synthase domain-containing protein [Streptomyces sp. OR43]|uniref:wax ester/triacylglycerol synthase domain-containing protein n=1 Tax=Streptomyces sp. or43 TaxID=2478957 RepID=UPI0016515C59|nr:wax ester/triacylglycerol synthase domain-containing protein [Streptomyces sp. or43]
MAQTHPSVAQTIGVVLHLDGDAPPLAELRRHVASHLDHEPRLTHYLRGPGLKARWFHDPSPDLSIRVREQRCPTGAQHLEAALTDLVARPLPDAGPLWDIWLLSGYAPGRYSLCLRAHHSTQDGMGMVGTLTTLFGTVPAPARQPLIRAGAGAYLGTVRDMLSASATHDVWNHSALPLAGSRAIGWTEVPTQHLRKAATARGGDTNDGFLAALGGALRTWTSQAWPRGADRRLPAITMVNLRRAGERDRPGNYIGFAPAPLPCHEPTAEGRLDHIIAATRSSKDPGRLTAMRSLMDVLPARVFQALATRMTTPGRSAVTTSYLAIHRPLGYGLDPVTHIQPFNWLPRHQPASVVACSYNGVTSVCFVTDTALPGLDQLPRLFRDAVDELPQADKVRGPSPRTGVVLPAPGAEIDASSLVDFGLIKDILVQQGGLPPAPITPQATPEQAGIDSLAVAVLSMTLEDLMGIVITEPELAQATTVADLAGLVARRAAPRSSHGRPDGRGPQPSSDRTRAVPQA